MAKNTKRKRMLVVDGSNYMNRGHYACKDLCTSDGFPTGAIKGTLAIILADLHILQPDYLLVVFDEKGKKNWRQIAYPAYKKSAAREAARKKAIAEGDHMGKQYKPLKEILDAIGIRVAAIAGEEADDIIGTIACMGAEEEIEVVIASMDKDFAQLVNRYIRLMNRDRHIGGPKTVREKFGVKPSQIVDYLTLMGDGVDNIPGIKGVAGGTAAKLINKHGDLKAIAAASSTFTPALKANFKAGRKHFKWTRPLVTIKTDVELDFDIEDCAMRKPKYNKLKRMCKEMELHETHRELLSVLRRIHA